MTADFARHDNAERPKQALSCGNRPPRVAFPNVPARPPLPARVDPSRWLRRLDRWRVVRKVDANGTITVQHERYSVGRALAGQRVVVAVDAAARELAVHHRQRPIKRLPLKGLLAGPLAFDAYLEALCREVRSRRRRAPRPARLAA